MSKSRQWIARVQNRGWSDPLKVTVVENTPPDTPGAPSGPPLGQPGISYIYYASTTDPNGDQITYVFDWGDGNTSMTESVGSGETVSLPHAWANSGEYGVRVNATDTNGASSEWSEPLVVVVGTEEQIPPVAIIAAVPMELSESGTVSFSADESSDQNGEIVSYEWDFGDESTGTGVNVEHTYTRSGEYTATLMVRDNDDLSDTDGVSILVRAPTTVPPTSTPVVTTPSAPRNLQATPGDRYIQLIWNAPSDDGGSPITEYKVYRSTAAGGETPLTTVGNVLTYTDKNVTNGQTCYYHVSAVNSAGEGAMSNEDSAKITQLPTEPGFDASLIAALITAIAIIVAAIINRRPIIAAIAEYSEKSAPKPPEKKQQYDLKKPEMKLILSAEPTEIPADGKSKSVITISVDDENGTPAPVPEEMEIVLETNIGLIDTPVRIPAGDAQARSILTSSTAGGTATVRAKSGTGLKNDVVVRFA